MSKRRGLVMAAVLAVVIVGGVVLVMGAGRKACPKVGCINQVSFDPSSVDDQTWQNAETVAICANSECRTSRVVEGEIPLVVTSVDDRVVTSASVTVVDGDGKELLHKELTGEHKAKTSTPNGAGCEPTCWFLGLALVGGALTAV